MSSLSWSQPRLLDRNGQITHYVITLRNRTEEKSVVIAANSRCDMGRTAIGDNDDDDCLPGRFSVTLSTLVPYVVYNVRVAAMNVNGTGPMTDPIVLISGEDSKLLLKNKCTCASHKALYMIVEQVHTFVYHMLFVVAEPGPPQNLRVVNFSDTNFVLQWDEPENSNGAITGYTVSKVLHVL